MPDESLEEFLDRTIDAVSLAGVRRALIEVCYLRARRQRRMAISTGAPMATSHWEDLARVLSIAEREAERREV